MQFIAKAIAAALLFTNLLVSTVNDYVRPTFLSTAAVQSNQDSGQEKRNSASSATSTVTFHWIPVAPPGDLQGVDAATFEIYATSTDALPTSGGSLICFARDKYYVYTNFEEYGEVVSTHPETFVPLDVLNPRSLYYGYCYGKDRAHAYSYFGGDGPHAGGGILAEADPRTFTTDAATYPFAKDATHVFLADHIVTKADPNTFIIIPNSNLAKDKTHIFVYGSPIMNYYYVLDGADAATFSYDPRTGIGRDRKHTWTPTDLEMD